MLRSSMQDTSQRIDELLSEIKSLHDTLKVKDKRIADLEKQLSDVLAQNKLGRKKRFVRSSEQARLLNNRDKDVRSEEKSDYDGSTNAPLHGEQVGTDNDQDLLQDQIFVQGCSHHVKFTYEKGNQLYAESMGKFEELYLGRTGSVKQ